MPFIDRRRFLALTAASLALPPSIARALQIDAKVRTGTIQDVQHVVILMQENRSFDHYFGAMNGVRGFGDRFPVPVADAADLKGATLWRQVNGKAKEGQPSVIAPFPLNTKQTFSHMRIEGTPHNWADAQNAWDGGRMSRWPEHKGAHAMGHYVKEDIPFQWALADAFTLCDAYHCAFQGGTNTNRLFLWTGTNNPDGRLGGPSISNTHDHLPTNDKDPSFPPYRWTTYVERLQAAGVSWRIYEDMADNFGDNPLVGFKSFRDSVARAPGSDRRLAALGLSTHHLDGLKADILADQLPQVSYVIAPSKDSEHPGPSSPAQGADYVARTLDALTANPDVWAKTVFLVMYDENDGFFDHAPPPAPPLREASGAVLGGSTVSTEGEYHTITNPVDGGAERSQLMGRPYGLGPRVPLWAVSPWSRGGWVNSQVFDHTSVIRFLEARFGVMEPNISPWRRAVCGDLTTAFDFETPNQDPFPNSLPPTAEVAARAAALPGRTKPPTPSVPAAPLQAKGARPSRALPYELHVEDAVTPEGVLLVFRNAGKAGAVLHVYDRHRLAAGPQHYTIEAGKVLQNSWPAGDYDLWVIGPNGFHRHFVGSTRTPGPRVSVSYRAVPLSKATAQPPAIQSGQTRYLPAEAGGAALNIEVLSAAETTILTHNAYDDAPPAPIKNVAHAVSSAASDVDHSRGWYDVSLKLASGGSWLRRYAGRIETGDHSTSDPAVGGLAIMQWRA